MTKPKKEKKKRTASKYAKCMGEQLGGGKMKGKTKSERTTMFKDAVKACKLPKEEEKTDKK